MTLKEHNLAQIKESQTPENRYYFWLKYGRNGTDTELLLYYIEFGGAKDFRKKQE